jgi:hypothetical protein
MRNVELDQRTVGLAVQAWLAEDRRRCGRARETVGAKAPTVKHAARAMAACRLALQLCFQSRPPTAYTFPT